MIAVLHHADADGFAAAWAVEQSMPAGTAFEFYKVNYGDSLTDTMLSAVRNAEATYIVDFSFSRQVLIDLAKLAGGKPITLIDHHKTAAVELGDGTWTPPPNLRLVIDIRMSGCELTWKTLNTALPPDFLAYIGDRDLWRWSLPDSRVISAWISAFPNTTEGFREMVAAWYATAHKDRVAEAGMIDRYRTNMIIRPSTFRSRECIIDGHLARIVNASTLQSEIGESILKQWPAVQIAIMYFDTNRLRVMTLRSLEGSNVDVSIICKKRGGGGHKHAAGFQIRPPCDIAMINPAKEDVVAG